MKRKLVALAALATASALVLAGCSSDADDSTDTATTPEQAELVTDQILTEAGRRLGIILAPVVGALNLLEIVLSGPPELLDGVLSAATVETILSRTMATETGELTLRMTAQGEDIVLRGAAVMVLSAQLGVS